jgi:hypothetical protein
MIKTIKETSSKYLKIYSSQTHLKIIAEGLFNINGKTLSTEEHLNAAFDWMCRAQDITKTGGVSAGYSFEDGWLPQYPETTGYIIPTFIKYSKLTNNKKYVERAIKMADWEIEIQMPDGAVRGDAGITSYPIVFDTGQVISGWTSLYKETGIGRFKDAAKKAGDWLISIQDEDGKWSKHTYNNIPHAYHSRVAWPILKLFSITDDDKYKIAAEKNIDWVLSLHKGNGWFNGMGFKWDDIPFTHTITYTLRGLLESSFYLDEEKKTKIRSLVIIAAKNIINCYETQYEKNEMLAGTLNSNWKPASNYTCLTGNAQVSIVWLKLYNLTGDVEFLSSAKKLLDQVKSKQNLKSSNLGIKGAIAGSFPIWGGYREYSYPNWAAKFFSDALMLLDSETK